MSKSRRSSDTLIARFLSSEASGGLLLMATAAMALLLANSPASSAYFALLHFGSGHLDVLHVINDGLMAIFFLLVGLEIKRELLNGELSTWSKRALPGVAALGGMAVPALIYVALQRGDPATLRGWATPAATDIAFSLAVLSLVGGRLPASLKVFLTALAIIDDLGAVLIIAVFYTSGLVGWPLGGAAVSLAILVVFNRFKVQALAPYLLVGIVMWGFTLLSGVHATVAGVALAFTIPLRPHPEGLDDDRSPLHRLERRLQKGVAFLIVPLFGFANAGVSLGALGTEALVAPVTLGAGIGLFVGKQIGVFGAARLAVALRIAALPERVRWRELYGVAILCGIGFTMSLFIGGLAFHDAKHQDLSKVGVLAGSLLSGVVGALYLVLLPKSSPGLKGVA